MKFSRVVLLGAATLATAHNHKHAAHHHPARHASPVEGRSPADVGPPGPVVTKYELNGADISYDKVLEGVKEGIYVLVGEKISNVIDAPYTPIPTPTPPPQAAKFFEEPTTTTSSYVTTTPKEIIAPSPAPAPKPSTAGSIGDDFPDGTLDCDDFKSFSKYGPVNLDYLGFGGYSGIQSCPGFSFGISDAISFIESPLSGNKCSRNQFCSYACPPGYLRSQWPKAQGAVGQSVGGVWCDPHGKIRLSRPEVPKVCIKGVGGVTVVNKLTEGIAICLTDYPGKEDETIPTWAAAGATTELSVNDQATYYHHQGLTTSLQFYVNNAGVSQQDGCVWGQTGEPWLGNWAPVNIGVSKATDGIIYLTLLPNTPTIDPSKVKLNFDISIKGGSVKCEYKNGKYMKDDVESPTGCTVGIASGGEGTFEFTS